ncbi:MAG: T9SS type A sorting domain-containing protein [Bacteroidota bacterium]
MKRSLLIVMMLLAMVGLTKAQVLADFELIKMNGMGESTYSAVTNPDTTGNHSAWVGKMNRAADNTPWGGFWCPLATAIDVTNNHYVHVKVWKPRLSPIKFKLEGGPSGTKEFVPMRDQSVVNGWEDIVFDVTEFTGAYPIVAFMPDFEDPLTLTEPIVIYFDDIMVNNDPHPNTESVSVIENFEQLIPLNIMFGDVAVDSSTMVVVPNPDIVGNESNWVVKFTRDKDGVPWGGFWSRLPQPYDVTTNKFIHVDVYKPRISPVYFKIEGGAAGNLEIESMNAQTLINAWEGFTWDFSAKTGNDYQIIAFMPDKIDPVGLTEDIVIYFDNIVLDNIGPGIAVDLNVDMHGSKLTAGQPVYFAGDFGGIYGTWNAPGDNPNCELIDLDGDSIYTANLALPAAGTFNFKFFKGVGWDGGEWTGDPNRKVTVTGPGAFTYKWGVKPVTAVFNVDMKGSKLAGETIYVAGDFGGIYGSWNAPGDNLNDALVAQTPLTDSIYSITLALDAAGTYNFKFFKGAGWNGGEWAGDPNRMLTIAKDTTVKFKWGSVFPYGIIDNALAGKVSVYPVPFRNNLTINTSVELKSVVVTTAIGQRVVTLDYPTVGTTTTNTSDLAPGLYFVTFYPKSGIAYSLKIMKY